MGQSHLLKTLAPVGMAMLGATFSLSIVPTEAQAQSAEAFAISEAVYRVCIGGEFVNGFCTNTSSIGGLTFQTSASSGALVDPGFTDNNSVDGSGDLIEAFSVVDPLNGFAISLASIEFDAGASLLLADNGALAVADAPPSTFAQADGRWSAVSNVFTAMDGDFLNLDITIDYLLGIEVINSLFAIADVRFDIFLDPDLRVDDDEIPLYNFQNSLSLMEPGFEEAGNPLEQSLSTFFGAGGVAPGDYSLVLEAVESVTVAAAPEPLTLLGASAAVAFGAAFKRRQSQ